MSISSGGPLTFGDPNNFNVNHPPKKKKRLLYTVLMAYFLVGILIIIIYPIVHLLSDSYFSFMTYMYSERKLCLECELSDFFHYLRAAEQVVRIIFNTGWSKKYLPMLYEL